MTVSHTNSALRYNCHIQLGPESVRTLTETYVYYLLGTKNPENRVF